MIKGLYRSAAGMLPGIRKQEAVANNIANAGTTGFKKDIVFTRELSRAERRLTPPRSDWQQTLDSRVHIDHAQGVFDKTTNPLHLAIEGDGFFVLQGNDGSRFLTRSGAFVVDSEGFLAFPGGYRLLGDGGPVQVGSGTLVVGKGGGVEVDGVAAGRISSQSVNDVTRLERLGRSLFVVPEGEELIPAISATIQQGYLETSNVDVVTEMVDMIASYRAFEANARAIQSQEDTLDHLFSKVAGNR